MRTNWIELMQALHALKEGKQTIVGVSYTDRPKRAQQEASRRARQLGIRIASHRIIAEKRIMLYLDCSTGNNAT